MFNEQSYNRHSEWYNQHFPTDAVKEAFYQRVKSTDKNALSHWLQQVFFDCLSPLLKKPHNWLTVGDAYGFDAQYILLKGSPAIATDLNSDFLAVAHQQGIVNQYVAENAESLSFNDNRFDYVLCKEAYHHFPRPYAALYQMIRVAQKAIVIIEPQDPVLKMPLLLLLTNLFSFSSKLSNRVWKNRFSFEPVGNFIYKVSEREFEKFAAGLNLPMVAFKHINPNFYFKGAEDVLVNIWNRKFLFIKIKKRVLDILVKVKIIPGQVLSTIIFKELPNKKMIAELKKKGYRIVAIPDNPYIK